MGEIFSLALAFRSQWRVVTPSFLYSIPLFYKKQAKKPPQSVFCADERALSDCIPRTLLPSSAMSSVAPQVISTARMAPHNKRWPPVMAQMVVSTAHLSCMVARLRCSAMSTSPPPTCCTSSPSRII